MNITKSQNWHPFKVHPTKADLIRPLSSKEGVIDRLRLVAFAEVQARECFIWGAERFKGMVPDDWINTWMQFAKIEEKHAQMLLDRMNDLGADLSARAVSDKLSRLCMAAEDPILFLFLLSSAEERGMESGNILGEQMKQFDPISAKVFQDIAEEEVEHVRMAKTALASYEEEALRVRARQLSNSLH